MNGSHQYRQFLVSHVLASSWIESEMGTLQNLWAVSRTDEPLSVDEMTETARMFEAPLMFKQGLTLQTEDLDTAARYFRNALEYRSDFLEARVSLGAVLAEQNKLDEAEVEFRAVLDEDPTYAENALPTWHLRLETRRLREGSQVV